MAQVSTPRLTFTQEYREHVRKAGIYEVKATKRRERVLEYLAEKNPNASSEWYEIEASKDYYFKSYVASQQFHARQATMYGPGAILEVLGGLVAEIRAFGHRP